MTDFDRGPGPPQLHPPADPSLPPDVVQRLAHAQANDPSTLLDALIRFSGLVQRTPTDRIERAIGEEYEWLSRLPVAQGPDARSRFEKRLQWLISGSALDELKTLDPVADCDQIRQRVSSAFRVEGRILEALAINRIAQSNELLVLIRGTRRAEDEPVTRFQDTYTLLANFFEWGPESLRGTTTVSRIRAIHGRYSIPNVGMKYILLTTAFTWLDGAALIGHRPLLRIEKLGVFHSLVNLGRAMQIRDIEHDYEAMYAWHQAFNAEHRGFHPAKATTFQRIALGSLLPVKAPALQQALKLAFATAMAPDYRAAVGVAEPTPQQQQAVRAALFTLGTLAESQPSPVFIRSLQNSPAHRTYTRPQELGAGKRSENMPTRDPSAPNGGFPEHQAPFYGGATPEPNLRLIPWREIQAHSTLEHPWVVIDDLVYDLTALVAAHPGGQAVLESYAGKDASAAYKQAGHSAFTSVIRRNYCIGRLDPDATR